MGKAYENLKKQRCLQVVQECARSGKSKREWCAENGIGYSTFMRWQNGFGMNWPESFWRRRRSCRCRWNCRNKLPIGTQGRLWQRLSLRVAKKASRSEPETSTFVYPRIHRQTIWQAW